MIKEILRKKRNVDTSKIMKKLNQITDGNFEFKEDYEISWEIKKISHKTRGAKSK